MPPRHPQRQPWLALALAGALLAAGPMFTPAHGHGVAPPGGRPTYVNVTVAAGLGGFLHGGWTGDGDIQNGDNPLFTDIIGPGACWLDYDTDGWMDLYLVNQLYVTHPENNTLKDPHGKLYRNLRDGTFADVAAASGTDLRGVYMGCAAADYDDDGDPDLYVTGWAGNVLLRNRGDGTFEDVTALAGVADEDCGAFKCWSSSASWFDADRDGCLDLYVNHFGDFDPDNPPPGNGPEHAPGQKNTFFRSDCDGTFTDHTDAAGLGAEHSNTWSSVAADLDHDGWPDLYVSNDGDENDLYLNDRDGTFTRKAGSATLDPRHGMGTAIGDGDLDGRWDIVTTNYVGEHNGIFLGSGSDWVDVGAQAPFTDALDWSGWATHWTEINNDGLPDLMVINGMTEDTGPGLPLLEPVLLYERQAGGWVIVRDDVGPDLARDFAGRGGAWADYDNDGDVDVLLAEAGEAPTHLFRADAVGGTFLSVDLVGSGAGGRDAAGAVVRVRAPGLAPQMQSKALGSGFLGSNDPRLHFGLGAARSAEVEVTWPDGAVQTWAGLRANTFVRLTKGQAGAEAVRELPFVDLAGPVSVRRLEAATFTATIEPAGGAGVASVSWDFGTAQNPAGPVVTHAFDDVGLFTVAVTATDTLGRTRTQTLGVRVWDELAAEVQPDAPAFLPTERARGNVTVQFSNGDPVRGAAVRLEVRTGTGHAAVDAAVAGLAPEVRALLGHRVFTFDLATGPDGRAAFQVPWTLESPLVLVPFKAYHPGVHDARAEGGARGSVFPPAAAQYAIGLALPRA